MKLQVFFAKFWPTTTAQYFTLGGLFKAFILTFTSLHNLNEIGSVFCQILAYHDRAILHTWGIFKAFILTFTSLHNLNEIGSVFCQILAYHNRAILYTWGAFQSFYFNIHITT